MSQTRRNLLQVGIGSILAASVPVAMADVRTREQDAHKQGYDNSCFNIREYGAKGDGVNLDTDAINRTIDAAAEAGGGTVRFPAGNYLCYSIRLKSNIRLELTVGATIIAASTPLEGMTNGGYDRAEPNQFDSYQDFGHSHWHNSLIWGENLHEISIVGPGRIWGRGLSRGNYRDRDIPKAESPGVGNKAIALKNCHNVLLRDFSVLQGGHFAVLATGVDNLSIHNLLIDTNRDGLDIDCCRNVRVTNCSVNSPWDDGICPKSSFALGYKRATENLTISDCYVTGLWKVGTMLDGTFQRFSVEELRSPVGRIKFGTESNGGFRGITVANCVFEACRGLALESADGADIEDVVISNVTMRDLRTAPLFIRLGSRMRGPASSTIGKVRRIRISNLVCHCSASEVSSSLTGIPGHPVEDILIENLYIEHPGKGTIEMAKRIPDEHEDSYPEPSMFGKLPSHGIFLRHVRNVSLSNIQLVCRMPDARPAIWMDDVENVDLFRVRLRGESRALRIGHGRDITINSCPNLENRTIPAISNTLVF